MKVKQWGRQKNDELREFKEISPIRLLGRNGLGNKGVLDVAGWYISLVLKSVFITEKLGEV